MQDLIVDLHIHSHYSRATSKDMNLENLYWWGKVKGINILGTGDCLHPLWLEEIKKKLEYQENGLYVLKPDISRLLDSRLPKSVVGNPIFFIPTVEISTVYRRHNRLRKVHSVVVLPTLEDAQLLSQKLAQIGNISVDGRPTLGLDTQQLLEIVIAVSTQALFFPAHIWTPWFGVFGSQSGFDSLPEAFGDHASQVVALETGMSSDPPMNWRLSRHDHLVFISNSDAHSPRKLGREANILRCKVEYQDVISAIKTGDRRFVGTIEFFPQEGKYHWDGHRKCHVAFAPWETKLHQGVCPSCHRSLTMGVLNRIESLADRESPVKPLPKKVDYIVPLSEILAEILELKSDVGKTVQAE